MSDARARDAERRWRAEGQRVDQWEALGRELERAGDLAIARLLRYGRRWAARLDRHMALTSSPPRDEPEEWRRRKLAGVVDRHLAYLTGDRGRAIRAWLELRRRGLLPVAGPTWLERLHGVIQADQDYRALSAGPARRRAEAVLERAGQQAAALDEGHGRCPVLGCGLSRYPGLPRCRRHEARNRLGMGTHPARVAQALGVNVSTVRRWGQEDREPADPDEPAPEWLRAAWRCAVELRDDAAGRGWTRIAREAELLRQWISEGRDPGLRPARARGLVEALRWAHSDELAPRRRLQVCSDAGVGPSTLMRWARRALEEPSLETIRG